MAAGLPVIATDVGGVRELVVEGETGLLVPPAESVAMAAALERLLAQPELRRRLGTAGRRRAREHFDIRAARDAHVRLYVAELEREGIGSAIP
jgi:glycosyltransferase involved in cell wall biosynthesis